jgi:hypothetical protein
MISEIDLLREDIPRLEKTFGMNNAFVKVLKAQLALLQNQMKQVPQLKQRHLRILNFKKLQIQKKHEHSDNP